MVIIMDCLFCKIIEGSIPSRTLYEDDIVKVIMDVNPNANGHTLVIPKKHVTDFEELDDATLVHIHNVAKDIKKLLYKALNPDGIVLVNNYGITQVIKHYHLHIIPAYKEKQPLKDVEEVFTKIMEQKNWYLDISF